MACMIVQQIVNQIWQVTFQCCPCVLYSDSPKFDLINFGEHHEVLLSYCYEYKYADLSWILWFSF